MNKNCIPNIFYALIMTAFIAGCGKQVTDIPTTDLKTSTEPITSSLPSQIGIPETKILTQETTPTSNPLPSVTPASTTRKYQLTFLTDDRNPGSGDYSGTWSKLNAVNLECLDKEAPCFSNPTELFQISRKGDGPRMPLYNYSWSPNGSQIAICAIGVNDNTDIFIGNWDGKSWVNITNSPISECDPVWSPDGLNIVYSAYSYDLYQGSRLFEYDVESKRITQLLENAKISNPGFPSFSPDGKKIAFNDDKSGHYQIFISDLNGSSILQLTDDLANHYSPSFSPNGQWISLSRDINPDKQSLYIIKSNGLDEFKVKVGSNLLVSKWAPLGSWIAYSMSDHGVIGIHIIKIDGTQDITVVQGNKDIYEPGWRLIPPCAGRSGC